LINSSISGKSKVFCIAGVSLGGTVTVAGSFSWIEILYTPFFKPSVLKGRSPQKMPFFKSIL
jgi:hypothetical protein